GEYRVLFRARDRAGTACEGGVAVQVAGEEPDLAKEARLRFEKAVYHEGEEARLFLNSPVAGRHALLTFEGERVIAHRVIRVDSRSAELPVAMEARFSPNITAAVAIPAANTLHRAQDEAIVLEYLQVEVAPDKPEYRPGETARLSIRATDPGGRPREAEFSLAVIDASILQLQPDLAEPVKPFFYDQRRAHAVATGSSYSFRYEGVTTRKPEELLAEELRREEEKAKKSEALESGPSEGLMFDRRLSLSLKAAPRPEAPPPKPRAAGMAGGGGRRNAIRRALEKADGIAVPGEDGAVESLEEAERLHDLAFDKQGAEVDRKALDAGQGFEFEPGGEAPAPLEPTVRRNFADTALWRHDLRTGKDGKTELTFTVPDNLTSWRAQLTGGTRPAAGSLLVGDGECRFRSKKGLLIRLQAPRFLTRADQASVTTPVHNYLPEAIDVAVELAAKEIESRGVSKTALRIGAGDVAAVEW
ncbi:MAG: alpha-2-macroglobulin family protein, partial [Thermoanaerobaculia bacterium]